MARSMIKMVVYVTQEARLVRLSDSPTGKLRYKPYAYQCSHTLILFARDTRDKIRYDAINNLLMSYLISMGMSPHDLRLVDKTRKTRKINISEMQKRLFD